MSRDLAQVFVNRSMSNTAELALPNIDGSISPNDVLASGLFVSRDLRHGLDRIFITYSRMSARKPSLLSCVEM